MFLLEDDVCCQCEKHHGVDTRTKRQLHREVGTQSQGPLVGCPATETLDKEHPHDSIYFPLSLSFRMQLF